MSYRGRCDAKRARDAARRQAFAAALRAMPASPPISTQSILKNLYPQHGSPDWGPCVKDAYRRHWMTREALLKIPKWSRRPGIYDIAYRTNPTFAMLRKPPSAFALPKPSWRDAGVHTRGVR